MATTLISPFAAARELGGIVAFTLHHRSTAHARDAKITVLVANIIGVRGCAATAPTVRRDVWAMGGGGPKTAFMPVWR